MENLQIFYSLIPKHKHTEKLCMQVKRQIATLKAQIDEEKKRRKAGHAGRGWFIEKHGAAQVLLLGLTKSGKSSILNRITNAKPAVSHYPFSTTTPTAGMLPYQDISFQLVEAPSLQPTAEEAGWNLRILGLARNADGLALTVSLEEDCWQFEFMEKVLEESRILLEKPKTRVVIDRKNAGLGVHVLGKLADATHEDVRQLLNSYKIQNAIVKIYGEATLDDIEEAVFEGALYKPTVVLANKFDVKDGWEKLARLERMVDERLSVLPVSCRTWEGLDKLGQLLFDALEIIRIYTKQPSQKDYSPEPIIMKAGASVYDVAKDIHSSLHEQFGYAKVWGTSAKYDGEKVGREHILHDADIVEIHIK